MGLVIVHTSEPTLLALLASRGQQVNRSVFTAYPPRVPHNV
jgi:hypothetical protein